MANEFKIKHGFISTGDGSITGELTVTGAAYADNNSRIATRPWVTQFLSDNSYATSTDVSNAIDALVATAPGTLDTLNELAAALGDDPSFATNITNLIGTKLSLVGGTMTGNITFTDDAEGIVWSRNTDGASIKFYNTADGDTDSRLEFHTNDNNNEYFRWTHGPSGGALYEVMKLMPTGAGSSRLTVAGDIYAASNKVATETHVSANYLSKFHDITLTLTGDVSGSGTFNNMGDLSFDVQISDDSHNHDGRYYTETEIDTLLEGKLSTSGGGMTGDIDMAAGSGITFYGNGNGNHGIFGKDASGTASDDIRINSYHNVHINLDSNSNNSTETTFFTIGQHAGEGALSNVFTVDGAGNIVASGTLSASGYNKSNWDTAYDTTQSLGSAAFESANTFAAASHTHPISDIDGLEDELDAKQPAGSYLLTTGKAADSNLLDGVNSTSFLRSDADDTATGTMTFSNVVNLNGAVNFNGVNGQNFTVNTDASRIIWDFQRNGTRRMSFYHETNQDTFNFLFQSGNKLQINGNRILTTADSSSFDAAGAADTVNTRIDEEVLPAIPTNVSELTNDAGYITDGNTGWNNSYGFITASDNISGNAATATLATKASKLSVTSNDTFSGTYPVMWHDSDFIYSSTWMTVNGATDTLNVPNVTVSGNMRIGSISNPDGMIENTNGNYLHIGGWGVGRTAATAVLVNTAYRADRLDTARNIALAGDVTGNANFDGSANISITATVANDSHTHDGRYYTESESDARFVNVTGDTVTGDLAMSGATLSVTSTAEGTEAFFVDGVNGRLFTITDSLSDSLFSVNTISGLPVIEAFSDNTVKLGPFSNPVTIDGTGVLAIGGETAATQSYVTTAISNLVGGAPGALNTLNELAAAINDDASFASSVTSSLSLKAPLASPALTGTPTAPTQATSNNSTRIATTAFVKAQGYVTTDTNYYLNGISRSGNVLTFSVNGATNQTYTFGSAAWAATTAFDAAGTAASEAGAVSTRIDEEVLPLIQTPAITSNGTTPSLNSGISAAEIRSLIGAQASGSYLTSYTETDTLATVTARGNSTTGGITVNGHITMGGSATTTNQGRMIDFTGFDKEGTTDFSDRAYIQYTINTGGHSGSVLVISSQNDSGDGIAFLTNASSKLKHNGNNIATESYAAGAADAVQTWVGEQNFATDAAISTAVSNYLPLSGGNITGNTSINGDLDVGAIGKTSDTVVRSLADQSYKAGFEAYGNGQGTGYFYAGQSADYGGGFSYNGDGSPGFISGETADNITFFRRSAGTSTEVFHYAYSNNDVYFNGAVVASGSNSNDWNTAYGWGDHAAAGYAQGAFLPLTGGTVTGTIAANGGINMNNTNITNVNHITINDAGYGEGVQWSNWMIYDSPDDLSNAAGNFQISSIADNSIRITVDTNGNLYPSRDRLHTLGKDTNRWQIVFCEILDSAGQHEKNLQNPEGEKSIGDYATGTVLVWKGGKNIPCTEYADHMRMGVAVKDIASPLIQGAEPVLVTGIVKEGDYLITSRKEGHAEAISPELMRQQGLYDCVLGKALENGEGESYLVKTWINI